MSDDIEYPTAGLGEAEVIEIRFISGEGIGSLRFQFGSFKLEPSEVANFVMPSVAEVVSMARKKDAEIRSIQP